MSSRSNRGRFVHPTFPSSSRSASKARSIDLFTQSSSMSASNVLLLGETNIEETSILNLIAGPGEETRNRRHASRRGVRNFALDGRAFKAHVLPVNGTISQAALGAIHSKMVDLHKNGGVHLLVYCMKASHPSAWIHEIHPVIVSYSTSSSRIPVVAVLVGTSDEIQQERWWPRSEDASAGQEPRFDDHAFIQMATGAQSLAGDQISEIQRALHALILHNCTWTTKSETDSDRTPSDVQPYSGNSSVPSYLVASKPPSLISTSSTAIDVVLLGETGVGKSSIINVIARADIAEVSSDTIGCTKTAIKYTFEENGKMFHVYDTPGLVDPQMGVEPFVYPIDTIQRLIRSLGNGSGPDLLLFCIDNSKPTAALQRYYRLFYKVICEGKVPFALAVTKLEEGQDVDQWRTRHETTIRGYGVDCLGYIGLGRRKRNSDSNTALEGELRESLLSFFVACGDRQNDRIGSLRSSLGRMVGSVASFLRSQVSTPERILMNECGLEEQPARELVKRIISSKDIYTCKPHSTVTQRVRGSLEPVPH